MIWIAATMLRTQPARRVAKTIGAVRHRGHRDQARIKHE